MLKKVFHAKSLRKVMELIVIVTTLCLCLFMLLTPCAAMQIQEQSSQEQARDEIQLSLPTLPRKLLHLEEVAVKGYGGQSSTSYNKQKEDMSGKSYYKQQNKMHESKAGTWHEWMEGTDTSQYFTMDYSQVRRRRPIHNKSLPVGP